MFAGSSIGDITGSFSMHALNADRALQDVRPSELNKTATRMAHVAQIHRPAKVALHPCINAQDA
jgi:hypothetical protein